MYSHRCLKKDCGKDYQDTELDAYYCPDCVVLKKELAKTIDSKFNTVGQVPNSALTAFLANSKTMKDQNGREMSFIKERLS